ncbi:hypothetical protein TNCV_990801 [Trichonephila clavipes]|nr:hypothetical protein TNCV_990801 [Trichonephila clavipes]
MEGAVSSGLEFLLLHIGDKINFRKMFKNCYKEHLRIVSLELGETVAEKVTIVELTEIIKENKYFKEDVEFVKELIQYTIENRKKAEETRLRDTELKLANLHVGVNSDNEITGKGCNSLDALAKCSNPNDEGA